MNLLHLEYFYTVAREGGFMKASQLMRIGQPAISRMVATLEDSMQIKLFEKAGRGIKLTQEGQQVFEYCEKIFENVDNLKLSLGQIANTCQGPLTIGASDVVASHFLSKPISDLYQAFPSVYPQIYSGPASIILKKIEKSEIELGVFFYVPKLSDHLEIIHTINTKFRLVVHKDARKKSAVLEHFIGSREIDDTENKKFPTLQKLKAIYPKASIKTSSNNLQLHKELVLKQHGVSILPEFLIQKELEEKILVDVLKKEDFTFKLKIIKRRNRPLSLSNQEFLNKVSHRGSPQK